MRLGERLLAEKLITDEQLQEALEAQVVHGGRLGTNLVELGSLKEEDLARVLGQLHGCSYAWGDMVPEPQALAHADARLMDRYDVLPMRVDATRLSVAVLDPHAFQVLDGLAFKSGKRVVAVVIPEFRMNQLLRRHAKAWRPMRALDMHWVRPHPSKQEKAAAAAEAAQELMSEEEFQNLYAQVLSGGAEAQPEEVELPLLPLLEEERIQEPAPASVLRGVPDPPAPLAEPWVLHLPAAPPSALSPPPAQPPPSAPMPAAAAPTALVAAPPQDVSPLSFAVAQGQLARSSDREDVARTVLRYAVGKWRRALLLSVQGELLTGWAGLGEGVDEAAVHRIGIVLRAQSTFKLVRDLRSHYAGPMKHDAGTTVFYKLLGGGFPATAVLLPLLVRGKVVHLLYVDNGPGQVTPPDVGELLILSQSVARSYEGMIRRRQSA